MNNKFFNLFKGLMRGHGIYKLDGTTKQTKTGVKQEGKAVTVMGEVTPALWEKHLAGKQGLGIVPINDDSECYFGAIDVDLYPIDIEALSVRLGELKLPLIVCRTKSGGAHLYLFCSEPIPAKIIIAKLNEFAMVLGFTGSEIFPKQANLASEDDVGNWINMPYFDAENTTRYAVKNMIALTPKQFLAYAAQLSVTLEQLEATVIDVDTRMEGGPPCLIHLSINGVPEGGRNTALYNYGVFCKQKFPDTWREELVACNNAYLNPPLGQKELEVLFKSLQRKEYFYTCTQHPLVDNCNKGVCKGCKYGVGASAAVDVEMGELTKIMTDPPTWIITIENIRMELTTDDLIMQSKFRKVCVNKLSMLPQLVKGPQWDEFVRSGLANCKIVEAPDDAGPSGMFAHYLRQFCTGPQRTDTKDELLVGRVYADEDKVYFRAADLLLFLDQRRFKSYDMRKAWSWVEGNGGGHSIFKLKGVKTQCWWVPSFDMIDSDLDLPVMPEEM